MVNEHWAIRSVMALIIAAGATSAPAGEIGATSRATLTIRASVAPRFEVRNIGSEADPAAATATSQSRGMCISANTSTRLYGVALLGPDSSSDRGPGGESLSFQWTSLEAPGEQADLAAGQSVSGFLASARPCGGANIPNARLTINLHPGGKQPQGAAQAATLLIVPE